MAASRSRLDLIQYALSPSTGPATKAAAIQKATVVVDDGISRICAPHHIAGKQPEEGQRTEGHGLLGTRGDQERQDERHQRPGAGRVGERAQLLGKPPLRVGRQDTQRQRHHDDDG